MVTCRPRVRAQSPGQRPTSALPATGGLPHPACTAQGSPSSLRVSIPGRKAVFAFLPSCLPSLLPSVLPAFLHSGSTEHTPVPSTVGSLQSQTSLPAPPSTELILIAHCLGPAGNVIHSLSCGTGPWGQRGAHWFPHLPLSSLPEPPSNKMPLRLTGYWLLKVLPLLSKAFSLMISIKKKKKDEVGP